MTDIQPFRALTAYLRQRKTVLISRWMGAAIRDAEIEKAEYLTRTQLSDHLPAVFEEICTALEHQDLDVAQVAIATDAREHGQWRWRQGYELDELVRELDLFRQAIAVDIETYASSNSQFKASHQAKARYVVDEVISFVTLGSIREVLRERDNKIEHFTSQLELTNEELRRSKRRVDQLYSMRLQVTRRVTHDLRNFLNIFASALDLAEKAPSKIEAALALAKRQIVDMKGLTDEMVDYTLILSERGITGFDTFQLQDLCEELVTASRLMTAEKGLAFKAEFDPLLFGTASTSNRLKVKQVALNLLSNASKYTATGEVGLFVTRIGDDHYRIRVTDTGVGIAEQDYERVFQEFERAAGDDFPGTGLGLAIVRELVASLGGEISFRSQEGKGSVFEVLLPIVSQLDRYLDSST